MSKLIEQSQSQILKICYGNDFSLNVSVSIWDADTSAWSKLDLSAASDVELFLVAQNGKRIKTTSSIEQDGSLVAQIPSTYLSKTLYSIEITFKMDGRNRRTYSPCMIQIVNSTDEAGASVSDYVTNDAYHFDIMVKNDVAWINVGTVPSEYITEEELGNVLVSYVKTEVLNSTLSNYVTNSSLSTTLHNYVTTSGLNITLSDYVTNSSLSTTLNDYATTQYVDDAVSQIDLSDYYTSSQVDTMLDDYVTTSGLNITLSDYVTNSSLSSTLGSYPTREEMIDSIDHSIHVAMIDVVHEEQLSNYVNTAEYDSTHHQILLQNNDDNILTTIATIDASPFIVDGMVDDVEIVNGNLVISFNTDAGKQDISIPISQIFDASNYYTSSQIDTMLADYVTNSSLTTTLSDYVTNSSLSTTLGDYVTSSDLSTTLGDYVETSDLTTTLSDYVTSSDLSTTLGDYVTNSSLSTTLSDYALDSDMTAAESDISSLDTRVTALEQGGPVPSNVVTSNDGNEIVCITQAQYDAMDQAGTLDSDVFYYITDDTNNYVTQTDLANYLQQGDNISDLTNDAGFITLSDVPTPSNMVTTDTTQTITARKTFSDEVAFSSADQSMSFVDNANGIRKTGKMARGAFNQAVIGQIWAPSTSATDNTWNCTNQVNTIKFQYVDANGSDIKNPTLHQLAKIDTTGIYEGTTLLANKYVQSSNIRNILQISQSDYDTLVNNSQVDANTLYVVV